MTVRPEDVELVRSWRAAAPDREVITVNTTFRAAPWADVLYAMDRAWWNVHKDEIKATFAGAKFAPARIDVVREVAELRRPAFDHFSNSGAGAVSLAIMRGARVVYLLGYDLRRGSGGRSHWHGDHPKPLTNGASIQRWFKFFDRLAKHASKSGVRVVNCTRDTALTCFERVTLESIVVVPAMAGADRLQRAVA